MRCTQKNLQLNDICNVVTRIQGSVHYIVYMCVHIYICYIYILYLLNRMYISIIFISYKYKFFIIFFLFIRIKKRYKK